MAPAGIESVRFIRRRHLVVRQAHPVKAEATSGMPARAAAGATPGPAPGGAPQDGVHPMATGARVEAIGRAHAADVNRTTIAWGETGTGDPRRSTPVRDTPPTSTSRPGSLAAAARSSATRTGTQQENPLPPVCGATEGRRGSRSSYLD